MTRDTAQEVLRVLDDELTIEHVIRMSPEDKKRLKYLLRFWTGQLEIVSQERGIASGDQKNPVAIAAQRGNTFVWGTLTSDGDVCKKEV
jgi:hypothetical protein